MGNNRYDTKANGQSFAELIYDAWGMPVSPNKFLSNDHDNYVFATFTGHIYDTTLDIYFAEARFYDANNHTWLAMDLIKDVLNWYQYCYGAPINYMDPDGENPVVVYLVKAAMEGAINMKRNIESILKDYIKTVEEVCNNLLKNINRSEDINLKTKYDFFAYREKCKKMDFFLGGINYRLHGKGCMAFNEKLFIDWEFGYRSKWCGIDPWKVAITLKKIIAFIQNIMREI